MRARKLTVTGGNADSILKQTVLLRPISSVALNNLIDSCSSAEDAQIAVGYAVSISLSKFTMCF
ncbi:hypothetical protein EV13_0703 [Prochlorococcus sp. MIT 0702]|nr:hypothetical protein EV12_0338 [Prochlorococcus sp. MIT 0701]KGG29899.1 hypothetical protein EV13_0703 [Prochlorococcus sp. MIT 0702]KGG34141.1 hypothetical protein EV14_1488 [Prochlorococcus sp. MIT 0703]